MTLVSVARAREIVLAYAAPRAPTLVPIAEAHGLVLTEDLVTPWDLPLADVSVMDGFAVRCDDLTPAVPSLRIVGESTAGHPFDGVLARGEAVRISTGAVLPRGADAVVPKEDASLEHERLHVDLAAYGERTPGRWVRPRGSELRAGDPVLAAGVRLGPTDLGVAAAIGRTHVPVHGRPRVAIVSTGDELVPVGTTPAPGQVVSSNAIALAAMIEAAGAVPLDLGIVRDDPEALADALARGLSADVLLTSGGISAGDHDLVANHLEALGVHLHLHGVALRPGKPTAFGTRGPTLVFALPGNPASGVVAFWLFVRPALRVLAGVRGSPEPPIVRVRLREPVRGAGPRAHVLRARLHPDGSATALPDQASGDHRSLADFDALLVVEPGIDRKDAGEILDALVVDPWWNERRSS